MKPILDIQKKCCARVQFGGQYGIIKRYGVSPEKPYACVQFGGRYTVTFNRFINIITLAVIFFLFSKNANASAITSPQIFTRGNFIYVVEEERVVFLSLDTRNSYTLYSSPDSMLNIVSAMRYDDIIWLSNNAGAVIAINMQTQTSEDFGRDLISGGGMISVDRRYVYLARENSLYRMDKISREWVTIAIPNSGANIIGIMSFNEHVHVITNSALHILTTQSGDWVSASHKNFSIGSGDFRVMGNNAIFTRANMIYKYDPSRRQFYTRALNENIRAIETSQEQAFVATNNRVHNIRIRDLSVTAMPLVPMLRDIISITQLDERVVAVTKNGLAIFTSPFDFDFVSYPEHINVGENVSAFNYDNHILLYTEENVIIYNHERKIWSGVAVRDRSAEVRITTQGWTSDGTHINISEEINPEIIGEATIKQLPAITQNEDGNSETEWGNTNTNATINLHTEWTSGRFLDITIDNSPHTLPPQKGFYYKGIEGDIVDRASFGEQGINMGASNVTPNVLTEGASVHLNGREKVDGRDMSVLTATAGGGHVLSKTYWRTFGYHRNGIYEFTADGNTQIIASSVKMYIDGRELPESDFIYEPHRNAVRLLRRDKADPTSIVQISFSARATPNEISEIEPFPQNHDGQYGFAEGAISPRSWMSARAGMLALKANDDAQLTPFVFAGLPVEFRSGTERSLLVHPEIAYDNITGAHAAAMSFGMREKRAFATYSGNVASENFEGIDRRTFGGQNVTGSHEASVGYDLLDNLRASFYTLNRSTENSDLSLYELRTSYTGNSFMPGMEFSASSNHADVYGRTRKEMFQVRVFDRTSRDLGATSRSANLNYDFAWSEYQDDNNERGRTVFGSVDVTPMRQFTITGATVYRLNPQSHYTRSEINPSLALYTNGHPLGFDAGADYSAGVAAFRDGRHDITMWRDLHTYIYPGVHIDALEKFVFYLRHARETHATTPNTISPLKYAFFTDDYTLYLRDANEFGLAYFPIDNLIITTLNSRYSESGQAATIVSRERAKLYLDNSSIEANFRLSTNEAWQNIYGDALYERRWNGTILTGVGAFAGNNETKGANALSTSFGGPILAASITRNLHGFINSVENSHILRITISEQTATNTARAEYAFYLRMQMPPNVSLVAEFGLHHANKDGTSAAGGLYLHAGF